MNQYRGIPHQIHAPPRESGPYSPSVRKKDYNPDSGPCELLRTHKKTKCHRSITDGLTDGASIQRPHTGTRDVKEAAIKAVYDSKMLLTIRVQIVRECPNTI